MTSDRPPARSHTRVTPDRHTQRPSWAGRPLSSRARIVIAPIAITRIVMTLACWLPALSRAADDDFFESKIRPILVDHCEMCHSQSSGKTGAGLSLDSRGGWAQGGDQGPAVVPGKPDESLLIRAIRHEDGVEAMPPKDDGKPLSPQQIADLVTWVSQGAFDPRVTADRLGGLSRDEAAKWWSFQPLSDPTPPDVDDPSLVETEIDRFIVAALRSQGLTQAPLADRRTWLRRASLDLTGLPPTPAEINDFLADNRPDAFERVIDRLLASPAYGERYGRHWLDVARYADTAGDGADYPVREARLYRDWVVRAFQDDLPWDDFIRHQIAGDILAQTAPAEDYASLVTATGFLAIGKRYGYSPAPDYQHLDFADAIDSVGRSLLGLSIGCARCHDHKYDPLSMRDYYALYGILQSTRWAFPGGEEQKRPSSFPPLVPPEEAKRAESAKAESLARLDAQIAELQRQKEASDPRFNAGGIDLDLESQPLDQPPNKPWLSQGPNHVTPEAQSPFAQIHPAGSRGVRLGSGLPTDGVRYVFSRPLRIADQPDANNPDPAAIRFAIDFRTLAQADKTDTPNDASAAPPTPAPGSCRFYLGRGVLESIAVECGISTTEFAIKDGADWKVISKLEPGRWYHLTLDIRPTTKTLAGSLSADGFKLDLEHLRLPEAWDGSIDTFICDGYGHQPGPSPIRDLDNVALQCEPFPTPDAPPATRREPTPDAKQQIARLDHELETIAAERKSVADSIPYPVAYGVSEGQPTNAKIQLRGEPDKLGEEVPRRFLEILGHDPLPNPESSSGRRELAEWLLRPENPLTARVWVNRVWQWHFGRGLVATTSDFGTRGELPSHPELLDWLTRRFIDSGWQVKELHRLIMRSRCYRLSADPFPDQTPGEPTTTGTTKPQPSPATDAQLAKRPEEVDPDNRLLWRFSRRPLDAETLRDSMLMVGGTLDRSLPNPHPFPDVNTWAFTIHRPFHAVYDSDHRSLYLMTQRNRRHPFLSLFDGADPNQSVAQRVETVTPTQALFLMNSPLVHQAAEGMAAALLRDGTDPENRLRAAFLLAWGREPSPHDLRRAAEFLDRYPAPSNDPDDPARWQAFARVLLTANPFLYVE